MLCGSINVRERPWASKRQPIDYRKCCTDRLNAPAHFRPKSQPAALPNDSNLLEKKLTNYWGYNTIGFFARHPRCAADVVNGLREFKEMVSKLHSTGLEVILDVVYNHTAEGNELGPTLSFKGI